MYTKFWSENLKMQRQIGRSRHIHEDNINMDLKEIDWEGVDWIHLTQDRVQQWADVNTVMDLQSP
jgi:hypothetical protein